MENGEGVMHTRKGPAGWLLAGILAVVLAPGPGTGDVARAEDAPAQAQGAGGPAEEARRLKEQGDAFAAQDRHAEAIAAYRAALVADPAVAREVEPSLGESLLWADRTEEAVRVLARAAARNPEDLETRKLLALGYRWSDRLDAAERLYRENLREQPGDVEQRTGLAVDLQWQGREREAVAEFHRVLEVRPDEEEALLGLSRSLLDMDLPEEAERSAARAVALDPKGKEAADQLAKVRRRLGRYLEGEVRGTYDTDQLSLWEMTLGAFGRPARGLDLGVVAKELLFRQGSPGKQQNVGELDSANGTGAAVLAAYRPGPSWSVRASAGMVWYDVAGFNPWTGSAGGTYFHGDLWRFALDWERAPYDTILSLQDRVTIDTVTATVTRVIPWKTEVAASASYLVARNENDAGEPRTNPGQRYELGLSRRLYLKDEVTRLTGLLRLGYLGYRYDLDVGMYDPRRQTWEEIGLDGRWAFRPRWEAFGTGMVGAQQEEGAGGSPTYSLEAGVEREIGAAGRVTLGAFLADSATAGQGEGYRRCGGYLRVRVPF
jgi:tetratricopeptide (TPR) repeat protein